MTYSNLSVSTKVEVFSLIETCGSLKDEKDFYAILEKIQFLIGQKMAIFGVGDLRTMKVITHLNLGYSSDFLDVIVEDTGRIRSPLFRQWLRNQSPQVCDFRKRSSFPAQSEFDPYFEHGLENIITHGILDGSQRYATYFSLACLPEGVNSTLVDLVEILAPYLHVAYTRLISVREPLSTAINVSTNNPIVELHQESGKTKRIDNSKLTKREVEVLQWVFIGKSNWDISSILYISENTVKNHVQRIIKKLEANNRQHAVAKAIEMKLIKM